MDEPYLNAMHYVSLTSYSLLDYISWGWGLPFTIKCYCEV